MKLHRRGKHEYVVLQLYTPSLFKDQESYDSLHLRVIGFNDHPPTHPTLKNDHDWLCGRSLKGVETFDAGVGGEIKTLLIIGKISARSDKNF
jgi:hypothetical protein